MNLSAYFNRIGYHGPAQCDLATLHAITQAHAQSIPFDNVDVVLRRSIVLTEEAIFHKLVTQVRGGYCFEHNNLLQQALTELGFSVRPLRAAVRLHQPDRQIAVGHTHLMLEVNLKGESWITDVGVGSTSLTQALLRVEDRIQATPHDNRRFQREGERWFHQIQRDAEWVDICEFSQNEMSLPDQRIASWYTSTHPDSSFQRELIVARAAEGGQRISLHGRQLVIRNAHGQPVHHQYAVDDEELLALLAHYFSLQLPAGTVFPTPTPP